MPKRTPPKIQEWRKPENLERMRGWAMDGLTYAEIAAHIGVSGGTLSGWVSKYPEIAEATATGKDVTDRRVEGALLKRALGYTVEETKTTVAVDKAGDKVQTVQKTNRHIPADPTAMIFWLKCRKPAEWRDKINLDIHGAIPVVISGADTLED